jgi:hypothetical protein
MNDVIFPVLALLFFLASWGLVIGCERLMGKPK